jgi:DNA-binding transcriptional ArsR family regulator
VQAGVERPVRLDEVAQILRSKQLVVDACRRTIRRGDAIGSLVTRPVLRALGVALASADPAGATRESLAEGAFGARRMNESTRARLRVEIGRLRRAIAGLAEVEPTGRGYALRPRRDARVVVLLPPAPGEASALLALLRGGESWSTSALATAMGSSQRTVQRALVALRDEGRVEVTGRGRSQRWVARPPEGFATTLLLVTRGPNG